MHIFNSDINKVGLYTEANARKRSPQTLGGKFAGGGVKLEFGVELWPQIANAATGGEDIVPFPVLVWNRNYYTCACCLIRATRPFK